MVVIFCHRRSYRPLRLFVYSRYCCTATAPRSEMPHRPTKKRTNFNTNSLEKAKQSIELWLACAWTKKKCWQRKASVVFQIKKTITVFNVIRIWYEYFFLVCVCVFGAVGFFSSSTLQTSTTSSISGQFIYCSIVGWSSLKISCHISISYL